ncbi:serine hydrolase [Mucisphaera sp.]|uniref:serine hydrolase n=1 Tax=Mucisphaera sp. TaxID=2913024 RepID=UPI003D135F22
MRSIGHCLCLGWLLSASAGGLTTQADSLPTLTALSNGSLAGLNVDVEVPGFEVRVLRAGEPIYHRAFGDWEIGRVAATDSSTKTVSGALMMSVAETSLLPFDLDSRLGEFLPEYDTPEKQAMTIRQAFSHTSGLDGQGSSSPILANPDLTLRQAAFLIGQQPLVNGPPGSTFAYGGLSMHSAGAAAQIATGVDYASLFEQRLAGPLGMTDSFFALASETHPRVAGGLASTATDYARFMDMLLNDGVDRVTGTRVLETASVEEMLTLQTSPDQPIANSPVDNNRYGIGVWLDQLQTGGPGVDALAAGARGFHSWIDESEELVFTFATDRSFFGNLRDLSSLMHAAILHDLSGERAGDLDGDGLVDAIDINLISAALRSGSTGPAFDLNGSGRVDELDRAFLVTGLLATAPGDSNLDGIVDLIDLSNLASNFATIGRGWEQGDFDGNSIVNLVDLSLLATSFGFGETITALPEPKSIMAILAGSVLLMRRVTAVDHSVSAGSQVTGI